MMFDTTSAVTKKAAMTRNRHDLMILAAFRSRPAKPGFADGWHRWRQDPALADARRTSYVLSRARSLASFASGARGT
jgi:hypothetical protein